MSAVTLVDAAAAAAADVLVVVVAAVVPHGPSMPDEYVAVDEVVVEVELAAADAVQLRNVPQVGDNTELVESNLGRGDN